jgi:hypothetical protein
VRPLEQYSPVLLRTYLRLVVTEVETEEVVDVNDGDGDDYEETVEVDETVDVEEEVTYED